MLSFHATLHARPATPLQTRPVMLGGREASALVIEPVGLATPFAASFEEAGERLQALPRMYFEPDGSFVWVSNAGGPAWQVDGVLYDRGGRLQHVDLKGTCPAAEFDGLLAALGWPATPVMFQLVREAVFLDEAEFRRVAARGSGEGPAG